MRADNHGMRQLMAKFSAAGLAAGLTFGGAVIAVAQEGGGDADPVDDTTTTTVIEDTTTTTVADTTTTTAAVEEPDDESDGDEAGGDADGEARAHPENHGKYVSQAAHDSPPGPGHGKAVSEVARSDAGKKSKPAKPSDD